MREILFRGKCIYNNEWVYGFLFITRKGQYNIKWYDPQFGSSKTSEVYPETIGQFTGLVDKNGKKIFEDDVFVHNNKYRYKVLWCNDHKGFYAEGINLSDYDYVGNFYEFCLEVNGNIHDSPELLEE